MLTSMITDKMRNAKNKTNATLEAELVWECISFRLVRPNTDQMRCTEVLNKLKERTKFDYLPTLAAKVLLLHNLVLKGTFNNDKGG